MTGSYDHHGAWRDDTVHEAVGAYALGVLDEAESAWFEAHLADCEPCARQLEDFSAVEPMLAALAGLPGGRGAPEIGERLAARPARASPTASSARCRARASGGAGAASSSSRPPSR